VWAFGGGEFFMRDFPGSFFCLFAADDRPPPTLTLSITTHLLELAVGQHGGQGRLARVLQADQGQLKLLVEKQAVIFVCVCVGFF
jgi:hypothetical protein